MRRLNFLYLLGPLSLSAWDNNEIRYSLRSIEKAFSPAWVGITGPEMPPFLKDIAYTPVTLQEGSRYKNMQRQILAACESPEVPEDLILMNDDFIVRDSPAWDWTPTHRGRAPGESKGNGWRRSIADTAIWLAERGFDNPFSYEGHTPFPFNKSSAVAILKDIIVNPKSLQFRTAYGNIMGIGGNLHPNAKTRDPEKWPAETPFWSLKSSVDQKVKDFLAAMLPNPSKWEV
jgi:hypothetical protein